MKVQLIRHTSGIEQLIGSTARLCYSDSNIDDLRVAHSKESNEALIRDLINKGHESPLEHATFTFAVEGVSRSLTHQLVRHRIAVFTQQSQRYVSLNTKEDEDDWFVVPPAIERDLDALELFTQEMERVANAYQKLTDMGIAPEDARSVLPNATATKIIFTMNGRALLNFFGLRCCTSAQLEIRTLANKMLKLCKEVCPVIFENAGAKCLALGYCNETRIACGRKPTADALGLK